MSEFLKQIVSLFFALPVTTRLFLEVFACFLALSLFFLILHILWTFIATIFGIDRHRDRPIRPVPARLYSTDWEREREQRRRELLRRIKR